MEIIRYHESIMYGHGPHGCHRTTTTPPIRYGMTYLDGALMLRLGRFRAFMWEAKK